MPASTTVPSIQISSPTIIEGQAAVFELELSNPPAGGSAISLLLGAAGDTATVDQDYAWELEYSVDGIHWQPTGMLGSFVLDPGVTRAWVRTATFADSLAEGAESLTLEATLFAAGSMEVPLASGQGIAHLVDAQPPVLPTVSVNDVAVAEGSDTHAVFTVTLSAAPVSPAQVHLALASGSASIGSDFANRLEVFDGSAWRAYDTKAGLSFAPGVTAVQVRAALVDDSAIEATETFTLTASPAHGVAGPAATGTATLADNDFARLCVNDVTVTEGASSHAVFTVGLSQALPGAAVVKLSLANGTAMSGSDYKNAIEVQVGGRWVAYDTAKGLSLPAGTASVAVRVQVLDDRLIEPQETFRLTATPVSGFGLKTLSATGTATIIDNDVPPPSLSIADSSVVEGNSGQKMMVFTVTRSGDLSVASSATYATSHGTAKGTDYVGVASGKVSFAAGESSKTISIAIKGDTAVEADETFKLTLSGAKGATLARDVATGTIINDDAPPPPTLSIANSSVVEGHSGQKMMVFTVTRSGDLSAASSATYATSNGTANSTDYVGVSAGTVSFAAGESSKTISIAVKGDKVVEADETLEITLSDAQGATLSRGQAIGTIIDDDAPPPPSISVTVGDRTGNESEHIWHGVWLSEKTTAATTFNFSITSGTAIVGIGRGRAEGDIDVDLSQTQFTDGVTQSGNTITVPAGISFFHVLVKANNDHNTNEGNEHYFVNVGNATGKGTIIDGPSSPLVLDLDGNGVQSTSVTDGTFFDHDGDGVKVATGWVGKGDGLLAIDLDGDGIISSGQEIFGNNTRLTDGSTARDGFEALAQYDDNRDGLIDSQDAVYDRLLVWRDADGDAVSDTGELASLGSHQVASLSLSWAASDTVQNGNLHSQVGLYTDTRGQAHELTDVWFRTGDREPALDLRDLLPVNDELPLAAQGAGPAERALGGHAASAAGSPLTVLDTLHNPAQDLLNRGFEHMA